MAIATACFRLAAVAMGPVSATTQLHVGRAGWNNRRLQPRQFRQPKV